MPRALLIALLGACAAAPSVAAAQDVVVMRRTVSEGIFKEHRWDEGEWTGPAACADKAPETRLVRCVRRSDGQVAPDASCQGTKPQQSREVERRDGCTYSWNYSDYGNYAEACSNSTYRERTATCQRSGMGSPVVPAPDQSSCTTAAQDLRQTAANHSGCTYAWRVVTNACDGVGNRERTFACQRSGGSIQPADVSTAADLERCGQMPALKVADDQCGSPNLLKNGGFEDGLKDWEQSSAWIETDSYYGNHSGSKSAYSNGYILQRVKLVAGKSYTLSFWVNGVMDRFNVEVMGGYSSINLYGIRQLPLTHPSRQMSYTFTANSSSEGIIFSGQFMIDDVVLKAN